MSNVMIYQPDRSSPFVQILTAKTARIEDGEIILDHAVRTQIKADGQIGAVDVAAREVAPLAADGRQRFRTFLSSAFNDT